MTSALARVEVLRAVATGGRTAIAHGRRLLGGLYEVGLSRSVLDDAATLAPGTRMLSLDAIHLVISQPREQSATTRTRS